MKILSVSLIIVVRATLFGFFLHFPYNNHAPARESNSLKIAHSVPPITYDNNSCSFSLTFSIACARWLSWFFSAMLNSAMVRPIPSIRKMRS